MKIAECFIKNKNVTRILLALRRIFVTGPKVDAEFLPGALEVTESPPSPIGRAISWAIILFIVMGVLWATFSHIEVVAVAQGKLVPIGEVKIIQSLEPGIVRDIAVSEGQHVDKGQLLLALDPTTSEADEVSLNQRLLHLRCEQELFNALLEWQQNTPESLPAISFPPQTSNTAKQLYKERLKQEILVVMNSLASLSSEFKRFEAQRQRISINRDKYTEILKIDEEVSKTYLSLYIKSVSSRFQWLAAEQARIKTEQDRAQIIEQLEEIAAARNGIQQEIARTFSTFRSEQLRKKTEVETEIASIEQELAKANMRNRLKLLNSPVSGYVHQLAVHTLGGIVQGGDTLMMVVPDGTELQLKVNVMNKDIGFVHTGQNAQVKLEAFPFTEYGLIDGEVTTISADAIQNEQGDLLFPCTIKLKQNNILLNGSPVHLRPGMVSTGEIVLRKRRLISYFLSPLLKHSQESLRER